VRGSSGTGLAYQPQGPEFKTHYGKKKKERKILQHPNYVFAYTYVYFFENIKW
jgi:hypothetical protein